MSGGFAAMVPQELYPQQCTYSMVAYGLAKAALSAHTNCNLWFLVTGLPQHVASTTHTHSHHQAMLQYMNWKLHRGNYTATATSFNSRVLTWHMFCTAGAAAQQEPRQVWSGASQQEQEPQQEPQVGLAPRPQPLWGWWQQWLPFACEGHRRQQGSGEQVDGDG